MLVCSRPLVADVTDFVVMGKQNLTSSMDGFTCSNDFGSHDVVERSFLAKDEILTKKTPRPCGVITRADRHPCPRSGYEKYSDSTPLFELSATCLNSLRKWSFASTIKS